MSQQRQWLWSRFESWPPVEIAGSRGKFRELSKKLFPFAIYSLTVTVALKKAADPGHESCEWCSFTTQHAFSLEEKARALSFPRTNSSPCWSGGRGLLLTLPCTAAWVMLWLLFPRTTGRLQTQGAKDPLWYNTGYESNYKTLVYQLHAGKKNKLRCWLFFSMIFTPVISCLAHKCFFLQVKMAKRGKLTSRLGNVQICHLATLLIP